MQKDGQLLINGVDVGAARLDLGIWDSPFESLMLPRENKFKAKWLVDDGGCPYKVVGEANFLSSNPRVCISMPTKTTEIGQKIFNAWLDCQIKLGNIKKPKSRYKYAGKYQIKMRKKRM